MAASRGHFLLASRLTVQCAAMGQQVTFREMKETAN
jgi:hypothetical protein